MGLLRFDIDTHMPPQKVAQVLRNLSKPPSWRERVDEARPYRGVVSSAEFRLREVDQVRHYLNPDLIGSLEADGNGTRVKVRLRPSKTAWMLFAVLAGWFVGQGGWGHLPLGFLVGGLLLLFGTHVLGRMAKDRMAHVLS